MPFRQQQQKDNDSAYSETMDNTKTDSRVTRKHDTSRPPSMASSILSYENSGLESDDDRSSIHQMEDEAIPNIEYYSGTMSIKKVASRPTMAQLHNAPDNRILELSPGQLAAAKGNADPTILEAAEHTPHTKFGWIRGVFIRCVLSIMGTMLYLRMGWVAGRAGLGMATVIVALSATVVTITALSMSALCTNGEVRAGGAYFMLSRSLGPEFGGTMGVVFALADAVASAMNVVGFAECLRDTLKDYGVVITDGGVNDVRIIAVILELIIFSVVMISVSWEAKIELALIVIVVVSFVNFVIGTFIPPSIEQQAKGFVGYSFSNFKTNFHPDWRGEDFVSILSVYFPSITGILAGAGISGELREPNTAIPKGTLLSILCTTLVYLGSIWITGVTNLRDASGSVADLRNGTLLLCHSGGNSTCKWGLQNDYQVMMLESGWWPLVLAGVFGTSISSAFTMIVSSPRTIQALCKDELYPHTVFLSKGSGKDHEPRRAYTLVMLIGMAIIAIGDLNLIAPLISNFYLASFLLINYACFDGSLAKSPGWRPAFKFYNMWVSLIGAGLCLAIMFVMEWRTALATVCVMIFLYVFLLRRKPNVNWGSSSQAHVYRSALQGMQTLMVTPEHIKTYRPQILCLTGNPIARCCLTDFVSNITRNRCLLICGNIILPDRAKLAEGSIKAHTDHIYSWFRQRKVKGFYSPAPAPNFYDGVKMLIQTAGLGKLQPNILFVGFKANWRNCAVKDSLDYFKMIHEAFDANLGLCILRVGGGLDCTEMLQRYELLEASKFQEYGLGSVGPGSAMAFETKSEPGFRHKRIYPSVPIPPAVTFSTLEALDTAVAKSTESSPAIKRANGLTADNLPYMEKGKLSRRDSGSSVASSNLDFMAPITLASEEPPASALSSDTVVKFEEPAIDNRPLSMIEEIGTRMRSFRKRHHLTPAQREVVYSMNQFREKLKKSTIDVYWLFDDGGLTVLIPQLLTMEKSFLEKGKLRIFTLSSNKGNAKHEEEKIREMLVMFRIRFADVIVLTDWHVNPSNAVIADFENTIAPFRVTSASDAVSISSQGKHIDTPSTPTPLREFCITDAEVAQLRDKTYRYLRTREIVMERSKEAQLIVITAPVPKTGKVSACMYMAWLDMLTRDLTPYNSPVLLVRGNQQSVLTFYS